MIENSKVQYDDAAQVQGADFMWVYQKFHKIRSRENDRYFWFFREKNEAV